MNDLFQDNLAPRLLINFGATSRRHKMLIQDPICVNLRNLRTFLLGTGEESADFADYTDG